MSQVKVTIIEGTTAPGMNKVFLCLGSNLGDRRWYIGEATRLLHRLAGTVAHVSSVYESEGWGTNSLKHYFNQVIELHSMLGPGELLDIIFDIEAMLGRLRNGRRNEDRVIDIDILFYERLIINEPQLQVPHPRLHLRRFVLLPLSELAPSLVHPVLKKSVYALLRECPDALFVHRVGQES